VAGLAGCADPGEDGADGARYTTREVDDGTTTVVRVENPGGGRTLSYSPDSGVELVEVVDGDLTLAMKDMDGDGELDPWEDWRLPATERAADLAPQLSTEQIAGLMLFSSHERAPGDGLTDAQRTYLSEDRVRNVLNAGPSDVEANVTWVNAMQAYVEGLAGEGEPYVPVNYSSDPRSTPKAGAAFVAAGDTISQWPSSLGLAATGDAAVTAQFAEMTSAEYRALGISTALSPQIDLDGWGAESVAAMIKHFPGDGMGEGGRESHSDAGKYAVYPGGNLDEHLVPFLANLDAASVMASYSVGLDGDGRPLFDERIATAYDAGKIDILREDNGYDGVIVTDWTVTMVDGEPEAVVGGRAWGAEHLSTDERHYAILRTGIDMFGGNNAVGPVLAAHDLWQADFEAGLLDVDADTRFQQSAERILRMMFQPGLYDDPYLDLAESQKIVGSAERVEAGTAAQLDSIVMLKNADGTVAEHDAADWSDATVYVPRSYSTGFAGVFGPAEYTEGETLDVEMLAEHVGAVVTDEAVLDADGHVVSYTAPDLSDVDLVLVGMRSPDNGTTFTSAGEDPETGAFYPLSLQYRPYTADGPHVRATSISGDLLPDGTRQNRSYLGATSRIANEADLDAFERAVAAVEASGRDIPVLALLKAANPVVPTEFEAAADAVLVSFGTSDEALVQVALGLHEPQGRLPITFPASMDAVEAQLEDVGGDTAPYVDSTGGTYALGFGLGWEGPVG
jgi:beta-glucosidase